VEVLRVRDHRLLSRDYGLSVNKKEGRRVKIVRWKSSIEEILSYIDNELVIYTRNTYWYYTSIHDRLFYIFYYSSLFLRSVYSTLLNIIRFFSARATMPRVRE